MRKRLNCLTTVLAAALILSVKPSSADENVWSSHGPYEAAVYSIAVDPRDSERIFAGTVYNGIYLSSNGGSTWSHIDDDTLTSNIRDIVFHPAGPDTMYAATRKGMYRSYNGGLSWGLLRPPGYWYNPLNDIEVNPYHNNVILAGADMATGYRSTDGGNTWTDLDLPWIAVLAIRTDPLRPDTMYVASQSGGHELAVLRSEDLGESWYSIHNDLDTGLISLDLQVNPVDSDILYLAGSRFPFTTPGISLEKTTDGGNHWFDITPDGLIEYSIKSLCISPFDHETLYICTRANGVMRSTDGGESWHDLNNGLSARNVVRITVDSTTGILYLGTTFQGIFRSTDDGASWQKISDNMKQAECTDMSVNPRNADTVYVATRGGAYRSIDGAASWERLQLDLPYFFTETNGDYVYVSFFDHERIGEGGIFRSTDGGESWETFTSGLPGGGVYRRMAISDYGDGTRRIFLGGIGLFYSDDVGESWELCEGGLPPEYYYWVIEASRADPQLLFTINGSEPNLIYRSLDCGDTWASLTAPPGSGTTNTIACDPVDPGIVYACRKTVGLFKSTDAGETWTDITNDLPRHPDYFGVFGIAVNPLDPQNLYVNSQYMGNFVSHNAGQNWEEFNEGLDTRYFEAMTAIPDSDTNRVYLATWPYSVWSITRTSTDLEDDTHPPDRFITLSNYPNPFNASTVIRYSLPEKSDVRIEIYNILGQKVATLLDGSREAGYHTVAWQADAEPSGVYFARLKTPESERNIKMVLLK
jgi:photosystem II stability/assembly factor-like uncharacterized protein